MSKKEVKKWIKAFKEAPFKCVAPPQVIEAMRVLGMVKPTHTPTNTK